LAELRRWLAAVDRLTQAVNSSTGLRAVLDLVADTARDLLGYDFCAVLLPDPAGSHLVITGWSGLSEEYVASVNADRPVRLEVGGAGQAPSGRAYSSGRTVAIADIAAEPQFVPWGGVARDQGYRAMVSVPLVADGAVLGTLNGYRARVHAFGDDEIERLTLLARHAAIALSAARLVDRLREQAELLRRSERIHRQLLDVALGGGGLHGIVVALAGLIGRPVLIEDPAGQVTALAGDAEGLPGADLRRSEPTEDGLVARVGPGAADAVGPPPGASVGTASGFRIWPVLVAGDVAARIWVPAADLSPLDLRAVEHATLVVSLELSRLRTGIEVELRVRGELLTDVLGGSAVESPSIRERARRLGHDLTGPSIAIVGRAEPIDPARRATVDQRTLAAAADLAARSRPRPLVGTHRGLLVVLWPSSPTEPAPAPDPMAAADLVRRAMRSVPGVAAATVAVAGPMTGHPRAFRTARGALELALAGGRVDVTVTLDGLGVAGLLLQLDDSAQLIGFADRTLAAVREHDDARGTHLLDTLRHYLSNGQSRGATATALHLHPNTVTQRLARIQALTGLDLTDPAAVVQIRAAVLVWDVARTGLEVARA
jgi:sugar diacid utilization regulator